jgi:valyl-tRNA synthetase
MKDIPTQYNPREVEQKWYKFWEERGFFKAEANPDKKPYCIVIPPPNITGILHMGHALNNTIQDILIRYKRMQGYSALWMPGTDHAGIATQNVVEKELAKSGRKRQDLGREGFLQEVWKWRQVYGSTIIEQLKRLGASCDWDRLRFTMDEGYSRSVKDVFLHLYKKGLIYQGDYIINWCPRCQTALSDEEAAHHDVEGNLYYIKYPLKDSKKDFITVATTRPETMLGDTAVAVNPKDKRYKDLIGKTAILPLLERPIKVIADELVDKEFGTGAVKVTPAHDPNDYQIGIRHKLEFINIMNPDGILNTNAGEYAGMDRFEAREAILEDLKDRKLLEKTQPHKHAVGHCYRCHTVVEPYLSKQWFVKMKPLAKPAIEAVKKGRIKFYPARWTKVYLNWMENIRDWCISRQIWWGHRIPVEGEQDVLDTWFSSWLWPFATFKDKKDLQYFYPTSTLVTAQEIIFFWVARMIMAGYEFMGKEPFEEVYIHGTVRDDTGRKMSKSLGNIIDPIQIIDEFGADALRFSIVSITAVGQDVFLSKDKFQAGRNFANKIWNASRFVLMNLSEDVDENEKSGLTLADKWILSRMYNTLKSLNKALDSYRFSEAANILYDFIWHKYCDWYVEISKISINQKSTQIILYKVLESSLRMLHPFMPFITEEIWGLLPHKKDPIIISQWPHMQEDLIDKPAQKDMEFLIDLIVSVRNIRSQMLVPLDKKVNIIVSTANKNDVKLIEENQQYIKTLAKVDNVKTQNFTCGPKRPKQSAMAVAGSAEVYVLLAGVIDIDAEKARLSKKISEMENILKGLSDRLKNKDFLKKAPEEVVEKEKEKEKQLSENIEKLKTSLKSLA